MKKKGIVVIAALLCVSIYALTLAACNGKPKTDGAFKLEVQKSSWYGDEKSAEVTLKNPDGKPVAKSSQSPVKKDDTDGEYGLYCFEKSVYDAYTDAQKKDYDFLSAAYSAGSGKDSDIFVYTSDTFGLPSGEYMLLALVKSTHNYQKIVTPAVQVTINDSFVERTFNFKNIVVKDADDKIVTDEDNEFVAMAASFVESNTGKTLICKANGEARGTVDFGNDSFDNLTGDQAAHYAAGKTNEKGETELRILLTDDNGDYTMVFMQGFKSGNTLTLKAAVEDGFYWEITFTC